MNNSPGWASPGSTPSDEPARGTQEQPSQEEQTVPGGQSSPPNWSKQQPPAGQWSAPTGIPGQSGPHGGTGRNTAGDRTRAWSPGPAGPGWGGHPGSQPPWGGAWAPGPQAAKPGVIPLRPLAVGEILDGAVATMRAHWRTVLGISLIVAVVAQTAITMVTGLWFQNGGREPSLTNDNIPPLRETLYEMGNSLAGTGITSAIGLLATIIVTGLLTMVVSRAVLGRSVTAGEAWRDARTQLPRLLGLLVLLPLFFAATVMVGMAPGLILTATGTVEAGLLLTMLGGLAASVVSIWLAIRYSLASPALMLEKQGVIAAMRRSAKLVRGAWWRVLGVQLLTLLLTGIVAFIIQIPATIIAFLVDGESLMDWANGTSDTTSWSFLIVLGVGAVISSTITFPISAGVTALLYVDQRIRREALDLELARAAGLPGYGADTPAAHPATPAPAATDMRAGSTPPAPAPASAAAPAGGAKSDGSTPEGPTADDGSPAEGNDASAPEPGTTPPGDTTPRDDVPTDGSGQRPHDTAPGS
ncbi:glycerophosphoryl diester phosphodiesterase membrane domain-containing protein [Streptomyces sp. NPDC054765]